jgi:hypothetical protein
MAVGAVMIQDQIITAILPFVPQIYQEVLRIVLFLVFLGVREVVKEYGQNIPEQEVA